MAEIDPLLQIVKNALQKTKHELPDDLEQAITTELAATIGRMQGDGYFYKDLSDQMLNGLRDIFKEISSVTAPDTKTKASQEAVHDAQSLFNEASLQLNAVLDTTFKAAEGIMGNAEGLLERNQQAVQLLKNWGYTCPDSINGFPLEELRALSAANVESVTSIMTELSFQDITGQRLKKVIAALAHIQNTVFDLYLSTGLMLKKRTEEPEKNLQDITAESLREVAEIKKSELKGPSADRSQSDVDSLLAELGF